MEFERDYVETTGYGIVLTFIGHGTLVIEYGDTVIHIDPWSALADYDAQTGADLILISHEHHDHLDPEAIRSLIREKTEIVLTEACRGQLRLDRTAMHVLRNGESLQCRGIRIDAVPAYNLGKSYHPPGIGNGYVLTCGSKRIYVAGDTENIPEMQNLQDIDIAFLPMNMPYTMTPAQAAEAARSIGPGILYPYHFGDTDTSELVELLGNTSIDVRIRRMG